MIIDLRNELGASAKGGVAMGVLLIVCAGLLAASAPGPEVLANIARRRRRSAATPTRTSGWRSGARRNGWRPSGSSTWPWPCSTSRRIPRRGA